MTASDLDVDGTLQWRGAQFSFETTTGVTCAYSPRLRELARKAAGSSVETEAVEPQTSTTTSADITLIEPYYGLDSSFTMQYQNEVKKLAAATGGSSQVSEDNARHDRRRCCRRRVERRCHLRQPRLHGL